MTYLDDNFFDVLNSLDPISSERLKEKISRGREECRTKKIHLDMIHNPYPSGGGFFYCENCLTSGEFYKS